MVFVKSLPLRIDRGTWASGFRFWLGITASSSLKYSTSVRTIPFTYWLNQVADTPNTDSSLRSRMVTIGSDHEQLRPAGVCPTAPNRFVIGLFVLLSKQTGVLKPRSSIRVIGIARPGTSLKPLSKAPGPPVSSGVGATGNSRANQVCTV